MENEDKNYNEFGVEKLIKALKMSSKETQDEVVQNYSLLTEREF